VPSGTKTALGIRDWQVVFALMFGFWAHFAAQNRAFRSNLLRKFRFNPLRLA
jgi:hypothetical protein